MTAAQVHFRLEFMMEANTIYTWEQLIWDHIVCNNISRRGKQTTKVMTVGKGLRGNLSKASLSVSTLFSKEVIEL